jgi:hypothetical protein
MLAPQTAAMMTGTLPTDEPEAMPPQQGADALATLHTRTVDALAGYEKMVEKAEPSFRPVAERFRTMHERHAGHIARMLAGYGVAADADGSFMGTVNKAVVTVRSWFDEIDEDVMDNVRSGEKSVLEAFDDAIAAPLAPSDVTGLRDLRDELALLLSDTAHLD